MSIFELAENLILVLTKLDIELGLAQPQLVTLFVIERFDSAFIRTFRKIFMKTHCRTTLVY